MHRQRDLVERDAELAQALGEIDRQRQKIRNVDDVEPHRRHAGSEIEQHRHRLRVVA
jgi:hypothetical protein